MASNKPETDRAERSAVKAPITGEGRGSEGRARAREAQTTTRGGKTASTKRMTEIQANAERARRKTARDAGQEIEDAHDDDSDIVSGAVPEQTPPNPGGGVADTARAEGNVEINESGAVYDKSFPDEREADENTTGSVAPVNKAE